MPTSSGSPASCSLCPFHCVPKPRVHKFPHNLGNHQNSRRQSGNMKFHTKDPEILGVNVVRATWRTGLWIAALSTAVLTDKRALQCSKFLPDAGLGSVTAHLKLLQGCSLPRNFGN